MVKNDFRDILASCALRVMRELGTSGNVGNIAITEGTKFVADLGFDSLMLMAFAVLVEEETGVDIPTSLVRQNKDASELVSIGDVCCLLEA